MPDGDGDADDGPDLEEIAGLGIGSFGSDSFGTTLPEDLEDIDEERYFGMGVSGFGASAFGGASTAIDPLPDFFQPLAAGEGGIGQQPIGGAFFTEDQHIPLIPDDIYPALFPQQESSDAETRLQRQLKPPFQDRDHWNDLVETVARDYDNFEETLQHVYATKFITLATGRSLNEFGDFANISREPGELDAQFRTRIMTEMRKHISGGTLPEILEMTANILGVDVESIETETNYDTEPARFDIIVPDDMLESAPVTQEQLVNELREITAAGVRPVIRTGGTFEHRSQEHAEEDPDDEEYGEDRGYNAGVYAGEYTL